jgi:FkbM family methyltransferase
VKSLIKKILGQFGYDLVQLPYPDSLGRKLQEVFRRFDINLACDVGARHGEYSGELRDYGYQGWISSFEPVSENFAAITANRGGDSRWKGFNMALGAEPARLEINVTAGSAMSSFKKPNEFAKNQFAEDSVITRTEEVEVSTLAAMLPELKKLVPDPRIYLKLDTQGFDLEVLKGATPILDHVYGLQSEVSIKPIYENMPPYTEAIAAYQSHGFELAGLFPVKADDHGAVIEFDCVMIRTNRS